jgi:hypothetical protein
VRVPGIQYQIYDIYIYTTLISKSRKHSGFGNGLAGHENGQDIEEISAFCIVVLKGGIIYGSRI